MVVAMLLTACNSRQKNEGATSTDKHEHTDGHDHDHDHDHVNDGDHSAHEGHGHSKEDRHNHGIDDSASHTDEILFTAEQARLIGLTTESVRPGNFQQVTKTNGQIQASQGDEAVIVATSNGIVSFSNPSIAEGAAIGAGQPIVTISAKKLLEGDPSVKARIEFETAQKEYQRVQELVKDQIISVREFEQTKLRYETARTAYEAQASNITASGVNVTSPISGYIKSRMVAQGEYVSVGQAIATVSQNKRLQLRAEVSENQYKTLKNVNSANFKPAYDEVVYKLSDLNGRLLSFGKAAGDQSFYIPVTFEFDNVGDIIPGSFTEVYLLSGQQENIISVPVSSITEEQGLNFVYLQLDEEGYKKQEVTLGQNNGERVEILSGLKNGDRVVTKGTYQVKLATTSSVMPEGHTH